MKIHKRRVSSAFASIKQLCCLGLPAATVAPTLLERIPQLIPSDGNSLFWCDESGVISDMISQQPTAMEVMPLYLTEFHEKLERNVFIGWSESRKFKHAVYFDQLLKVPYKEHVAQAFYGEILSVIGFHWGLCLAIWGADQCHGFLHIHRDKTRNAFVDSERHRLDMISEYLGHLMSAPGTLGDGFMNSALTIDHGVIIANSSGKVIHINEHANKLLYMLKNPQNLVPRWYKSGKIDLFTELIPELCYRLRLVFQSIENTPTPAIEVTNEFGRFELRSTPLNALSEEFPQLVNITITRKVPLSLAITDRLDNINLTPKQREIALGLCLGASTTKLASQLNITQGTVKSHTKDLYERLDVNDRTGLLSKVIAQDH